MYFQKVLRRPKRAPEPEVVAMALCSGCVTPKFCRDTNKCDVAGLKAPKKRAKRK